MDEATASVILKMVPLKVLIIGASLWLVAHYGRDYVKIVFEHNREVKRMALEHERRQAALSKRLEAKKVRRQRRK